MKLFFSFCSLVVCCPQMRRGWPRFIGGEEGGPWKMLPLLMKASNRRIGSLLLDETATPTLGKAVSINRPNLGPNGAGGGGCGRTMACSKSAHLRWATSYDLLDLGHGGVAQS